MSNVNPPPGPPPGAPPGSPGGPPGPPSGGGQKIPISIQDEMRTSYLDYAMSVIVGRAIPDARDGLKPVHRRILFSAFREGLVPGAASRKRRTILGALPRSYPPPPR